MTDLNALRVFERVVAAGSFTAAARALGMPKSTVSQRVGELEARLGVRLLQRTTRRLSLTDQGRAYHDRCVRILAEIEDADRAVARLQQAPRGLLRVTLPASMQFLGPALAGFLERFEGVQLEVLASDRPVNLVEESFDLAIRAGPLSDSTLVARRLGTIPFVVVASPPYVKSHGCPRRPRDLARHRCLVFGVGSHPRTWRLSRPDEALEVETTPTLAANDLDLLHDAAVGGVGVAVLPAFRCADDLRQGRLVRVLADWEAPSQPIHALYPSVRHLSPAVKAMLDHLQQLKPAPWTAP